MGVLERNRRRKAKQQQPSPMPSAVGAQVETPASVPASGDVNTPDTIPAQTATSAPTAPAVESRMVNDTPNVVTSPTTGLADAANVNLTIQQDNTPEWVKAGSYEDLVKINPNVSRAQYGYELSKYRRGQGLPDLTYQEWSNILKDQNPYETETERQKREKRLRRAEILNGVGSVLGNLVNYVRARNGNVAMNLSAGTEGYNRIERLRQGQEQLGRSYAKDYLGVIAHDRAEKAKESAAAAAAQQKERDYQYKEARLKIDIENARSERERKAAADELARLKFKHQQDTDAAKLKETQRHNKATESISRDRAKNGGGSGNKYLELETSEGKKRYTPSEYGNNWVHKAYQDMLKEPGGKSFEVHKQFGSNSSTPSEQEMYEAIAKFNESQWKNRFKSNRYGAASSQEKPPLE